MKEPSRNEILEYYEKLAPTYDKDRFGNSYGAYINQQEHRILSRIPYSSNGRLTLNIGCGTGRLMEFADYGIDISLKMLEQAKKNFPQKSFFEESAFSTHFPDNSFDRIISFHMLMHFSKEETSLMINEAKRLLKKGGQLIIDIPSKKRKVLTRNKTKGWHGANAFSIKELEIAFWEDWYLQNYYGILFFPIHRMPESLRFKLYSLDNLLCNSMLKEYASYLVTVMIKK